MHQITGVSATPMLTRMTAQSSVTYTVKVALIAVLRMATATMDVRATGGGPRVTNNATAPRERSVRET